MIVLPLVFLACSDMALNPPEMEGSFEGTFTISHSTGLVETGSVTFTFIDNRYTCTPNTAFLPPSGSGTFVVEGNIICLADTVLHTAEFDWTLILTGEFSMLFDGTHMVLDQHDQKYHRHRRIDLRRR